MPYDPNAEVRCAGCRRMYKRSEVTPHTSMILRRTFYLCANCERDENEKKSYPLMRTDDLYDNET